MNSSNLYYFPSSTSILYHVNYLVFQPYAESAGRIERPKRRFVLQFDSSTTPTQLHRLIKVQITGGATTPILLIKRTKMQIQRQIISGVLSVVDEQGRIQLHDKDRGGALATSIIFYPEY